MVTDHSVTAVGCYRIPFSDVQRFFATVVQIFPDIVLEQCPVLIGEHQARVLSWYKLVFFLIVVECYNSSFLIKCVTDYSVTRQHAVLIFMKKLCQTDAALSFYLRQSQSIHVFSPFAQWGVNQVCHVYVFHPCHVSPLLYSRVLRPVYVKNV